MNLFSLTWITNPVDPFTNSINQDLIKIVTAQSKRLITINNFSNNVTQYLAHNINFTTESQRKLVYDYINQVSYQPLYIAANFETDVIERLDKNVLSTSIRGAQTIIMHKINQLLQLNWNINNEHSDYINLQIFKNDDYLYKFNIIDPNGYPYYVSNKCLQYLQNNIDLNRWWGYICLGTDPLLHLLVKDLPYYQEIIYDDDLFLTPVSLASIEDIDTIDYMLVGLQNDHVALTNVTEYKYKILQELALVWKLTNIKYDEYHHTAIYRNDSDIRFFPSLKTWLNKAYDDVNNNLLPRVRWRPANLNTNLNNRKDLMYALIRGYGQLITNDNKYLGLFFPDIYVYDDNMLEARLGSLSDLEKLQEYLNNWLKLSNNWYHYLADDVLTAFLYRYYYLIKLPNSFPLAMRLDNKIYVTYNIADSGIDVPSKDQQQILITSLEKLLENNLTDLIDKVKLESGLYDPNDIVVPIDPGTKQALTEQQRFLLEYHDLGWMGWFPINNIDIDIPELNNIVLNYIPSRLYLKIPANKSELYLQHIEGTCLTSCNALLNKQDYDLIIINMDLNKDEQQQIAQLIDNMWRCGYFTSVWAANYYLFTKTYSIKLVHKLPYIYDAVASPQDSMIALTYLRLLNNSQCQVLKALT